MAIRNYHHFTYSSSPTLLRCLRQTPRSQSFFRRPFTTGQKPTDRLRNAINKTKHDHPVLFPVTFIAAFASVCYLLLVSYDEYTRDKTKLGPFPPAVEHHLRNAIHYTINKPDPDRAVISFTHAIEQAEKSGMDPFSPEFTGIHIRLAAAFEQFGQAKAALEVLSKLVESMLGRIEDIDRGRVAPKKVRTTSEGNMGGPKSTFNVLGVSGELETERGHLLKRAIESKIKISQLYESDHIQDDISAKRTIDEAMQLLVESMRDPKSLKFDENRAGISADEAAAMLSEVAGSNIVWGKLDTALEIYKLALIAVRKANKGKPSCREAYVLSSMQATVSLMLHTPNALIDGKPPTEASRKQARQLQGAWAQQSIQCMEAIEPTERDGLCLMAFATGWSGLANALMDLGNLKEARKMWQQAVDRKASNPLEEALAHSAREGLKELDKREGRR